MLAMVICLFKQVRCNRAVPSFPGNKLCFFGLFIPPRLNSGTAFQK